MALQIALLMALGAACQWLAWRLRIAAILPLLIASDTEQIAARKPGTATRPMKTGPRNASSSRTRNGNA